MKWINKQLSHLNYAEGYRSVALGGFFGFVSVFCTAISEGVQIDFALIMSFLSIYPSAVLMTALYVLIAKAGLNKSF